MEVKDLDIDGILERYPNDERYLIALLQDVQAHYRYISQNHLRLICDHLGVPLSRAYAVATFYKAFSLEPKGEHEIKVCLGTACHLKGGPRLVDALNRHLGIKPGMTTEDLKFSLETVNCLGACALAPVVVIDDRYFPKMTTRSLEKVVKDLYQE